METLVKTRQYGLLANYLYRSQYRRDSWQLIKICLRHGYKVKDVATWYDHINTLERLGMDVHNPLYLCPKNLRSEHNRLVEMLKRREEKARIEWERNAEIRCQIRQRKDDEAKETYPQRMSRYLDLVFSDGLIEITVLQTAEDFYNEDEAMHHCVYTNAYYAKDNSLVMSASSRSQSNQCNYFFTNISMSLMVSSALPDSSALSITEVNAVKTFLWFIFPCILAKWPMQVIASPRNSISRCDLMISIHRFSTHSGLLLDIVSISNNLLQKLMSSSVIRQDLTMLSRSDSFFLSSISFPILITSIQPFDC